MCNPADAIDRAGDAAGNTAETLNHPTSELLDKTVAPVGDNELVQDIFKGVVMYYLGAGAAGAMAGEGAAAGAGTAEGATTTTAGAESTGGATEGVSGSGGGAGGGGSFPPGEGEPGFAGESAPGATEPAGTKTGGKDILGTIKDLAPAISAGSAIVSAMSAASQASAAKSQANKQANTDLSPPAIPDLTAPAIDPDLTAIRKKNALLFGLDSPASTDITKGTADTGNLGRITLLGGSSRLSS